MTETLVERKNTEATVRPAGDVVAPQLPELRSVLRAAMAEGVQAITLDFSQVSMVDSAGLGLLIAAHNSLKKTGGRLAVARASREIQDLFRAMRIHRHFHISGD
jgi:anti-anti-sigma factor